MNRFDFSKTGGLPLTQDRLKWMQDGYIGAVNALASVCGGNKPVIVSGCELISGNATNGTIGDGWVWHPTLGVMPFEGGAFTEYNRNVVFTDLLSPLVFANGSSQSVQIKRYAKIVAGSNNSILDLLGNGWSVALGANNRSGWNAVLPAAFTGSKVLQGELLWRQDFISNMAHVRGFVVFTFPNPGFDSTLIGYSLCFENFAPSIDPVGRVIPFLAQISQGSADVGWLLDPTLNLISCDDGRLVSATSAGGAPDPKGLRLYIRIRGRQKDYPPANYRLSFDFSYHIK